MTPWKCRILGHQPYLDLSEAGEPLVYAHEIEEWERNSRPGILLDGIARQVVTGPVTRYCGRCGTDLPGEPRIGDRCKPIVPFEITEVVT